jgi:hypothetical protein
VTPRRMVTDWPPDTTHPRRLDGIERNHWPPRTGTTWVCPTCGERFQRASVRHSWQPARAAA